MIFEFTGLLRSAAENQRSIPIKADTLNSAVTELTMRYPELRRVLLDNAGNIRKAHRIVLNGEVVHQPDPKTPLSDHDHVEFFTAIAGG